MISGERLFIITLSIIAGFFALYPHSFHTLWSKKLGMSTPTPLFCIVVGLILFSWAIVLNHKSYLRSI